ncbi:DUF3618 domain-containing protein [uncultured Jatrophihabitans sp.]|uniref:DUF3618 domain-containing protein n=1 Tax=uncultured Jatrophihabitans sp. TaxID=1610747 RepID=UPI0035CAF612
MTNPDQLEADVARTRESLSKDVNRLNDRVSPGRFVGTRSDRIKQSASSMKDKLMGSKDNAGQVAGDKLGSAAGSVQDATNNAAGKLSDAAGGAPQAVRDQAQGNPVAAGLIAFGVGWLVSSLIPVSDAEQKAARKIEANSDALVDPLTESAKQVAGNLQQPLQDSAQALKETATDAANKTTEHAKSATQDVKSDAQSTAEDVKGDVQSTTNSQTNRSR